MRREIAGIFVALVVGVAGCGFQLSGGVAGDAGDIDAADAADAADAIDAPVPVTVGFALAASDVDEQAGMLSISVNLSAPAAGDVTVAYAFTDGTATSADYTATAGTLTFSGVTTRTIPLTIVNDGVAESDETFTITLSSPTNATLATSTHTVTIRAGMLPRVTMAAATSMNGESTMPPASTLTVQLDQIPTQAVSVQYTVSGTATATGPYADHLLAAGTVMFPIGAQTRTIPLPIIDDAREEADETVVVTLVNPTGALLGSLTTQTHTIVDTDTRPNVSFSAAVSGIVEGNLGTSTVTIDVVLNVESGRTLAIPFSVTGGTATANSDFTVMTASPLTFVEGVTSRTIVVQVIGDTTNEPDETVQLTIASSPNVTLGSPTTHTLTITNDEVFCAGTGSFAVCVPTPTVARTLPASIDTDTSPECAATQPTGWTTPQNQPASCFIVGTTIAAVVTTTVTGSRPLVLVASDAITVDGTIDVSSRVGGGGIGGSARTGPGANLGCPSFPAPLPGATSSGGGGGAGGSFGSIGGGGGRGDAGDGAGGTAPAPIAQSPATLRGGCHGQTGGMGDVNALQGGRGGGSVYLVATNSITFGGAGTINASGAGAPGSNGDSTGGGGGGSGGMIKLHAASITSLTATLFAHGGGGATGADDDDAGVAGADPGTVIGQAQGGTVFPSSGAGNGGDGYGTGPVFSPAQATSGTNGSNQNGGGGGGGGGGGFIGANVALNGTLSAGLIVAP